MGEIEAAEANIRRWCTDYIARTLKVPAGRVDPDATFARLGMDSAMAVFFLVELEEWLGIELASDVVFEHPSIAEIARYVTARFPARAAQAG